jgi:hypothetical protein
MNSKTPKDKTRLLQEFQRELRASGAVSGNHANALKEAEEELRPYFENPDLLSRALGIGAMTYEYTFLRVKRSEPWVAEGVRSILSDFRNARKRNNDRCLKTWGDWIQSTDRAISNVGSVAILQVEKSDLEPHLLVKSTLRELADILEGSLKPFARLRLKMREIEGLRKSDRKPVEELSFGEIIDELILKVGDGEMYSPLPFRIAASQWRNIANHNSYDTKGDCVTCSYGTTGKQKTFQCSPKNIFDVACYFNDLCYVHKVAIEIFGVDNVNGWSSPDLAITDFTKDATLAFGLVAAGFEICYATQRENMWRLALKDESGRDKAAAKAALQQAVLSYTLMNHGSHFEAAVYSKNVTHRIGFISSISKNQNPPSADFRGDIFDLDKNFRPVSKIKK